MDPSPADADADPPHTRRRGQGFPETYAKVARVANSGGATLGSRARRHSEIYVTRSNWIELD